MKKLFLLIIFVILTIGIYAQPPMGSGGQGMRRPPMDNGGNTTQSDEIIIMEFPEIQDLTLKQREKLSSAIVTEKKKTHQLMMKQMFLNIEAERGKKSKTFDQRKNDQKIQKINKEIEKERVKADKKYRSILTSDQYNEFVAKRGDIKFKEFGFKRRENSSFSPMDRPGSRPRPDQLTGGDNL